jgi:hypothetical protein
MVVKRKAEHHKAILSIVVGGSVLLSFLLGFLIIRSEKAHNLGVEFAAVKETYYFSLLILAVILTTAFFLGFIAWVVFKRKKPEKLFYFIVFNTLGMLLLLAADTSLCYKIWHYNKYQLNIDYNESMASRTGVYLDTCMLLVQNEIRKKGLSLNDFRILSYDYERALATIPKDTSNRFYLFDIIYSTNNRAEKTVRAAGYLVNFHEKIKTIYDVEVNNKKAEKQIKSLREDLKNLRNQLEKLPDSSDKFSTNLKRD